MSNSLYLGKKKFRDYLKKMILKIVISKKVVMLEEVLNSTQVLNTYFIDNMKNLYNDKAYEKSWLVVHTYKNKKKVLCKCIHQNTRS